MKQTIVVVDDAPCDFSIRDGIAELIFEFPVKGYRDVVKRGKSCPHFFSPVFPGG